MLLIKSNTHRISTIFKRYFSIHKPKANIRVRFAPSPTGDIHFGGFRTALFNYIYAKQNNGSFILRIEDTDKNRLVPGAQAKLEALLHWTGIEPDESPTHGGNYGPYVQSERLTIYKKYVDQLVEKGAAYPCFCSDVRLKLMKKESARLHQHGRYDNRCRHLTPQEIKDKMVAGTPHCIRFKLIEGPVNFHDIVLGHLSIDTSLTEGDPVILKSDGYPTYHLACVVDDHLMEVSHVLRGIEWHTSTPKHLMLYQALGWNPPLFAHLPLIVDRWMWQQGKEALQKTGRYQSGSIQEAAISFGAYHFLISRLDNINKLAINRFMEDPRTSQEILDNLRGLIQSHFTPDRYAVLFYGTYEISKLSSNHLLPYAENKEKLGRIKKLKYFMKAMDEIENNPRIEVPSLTTEQSTANTDIVKTTKPKKTAAKKEKSEKNAAKKEKSEKAAAKKEKSEKTAAKKENSEKTVAKKESKPDKKSKKISSESVMSEKNEDDSPKKKYNKRKPNKSSKTKYEKSKRYISSDSSSESESESVKKQSKKKDESKKSKLHVVQAMINMVVSAQKKNAPHIYTCDKQIDFCTYKCASVLFGYLHSLVGLEFCKNREAFRAFFNFYLGKKKVPNEGFNPRSE
ncbi:EARS2 [Cordylochernes scorpioides]|uniref:Nondiscriminating glutamyl-tRNA synthetase EARS2, mitochondrial n=1 Tax=Cordylochernes scorpioides TaxID=51811 RepID=A0ABY6K8I5_9ARAC|nr:EARS2 [Cordylochernes scorpioides]